MNDVISDVVVASVVAVVVLVEVISDEQPLEELNKYNEA